MFGVVTQVNRINSQIGAIKKASKKTQSSPLAKHDLMHYIADLTPNSTPKWLPPYHLKPLIDALERTLHEPVRLLVSVPPRHGKTETLLRAISWILMKKPNYLIGYIAHTARLAQSKSRSARDYALLSGIELRNDSASVQEWITPQKGGLIAQGVEGPLTGHGLQLLIVDDPHKDRKEAESFKIRQNIAEWFTSTGLSRLTPIGSVVVCHTRWHEDDLIGRLQQSSNIKWEVINLPVINEDNLALFPDGGWSIDVLNERKKLVGPYDWASLYMGQPRPRELKLFNNAYYYSEIPLDSLRYSIGIDLAYTQNKYSDYSVALVMATDKQDNCYILDVQRMRVDAPKFAVSLQQLKNKYPHAPIMAIIGGTEKGVIDLLNKNYNLTIQSMNATSSKFVRSQQVAVLWNNGKIMLPERNLPWVEPFISELGHFSGIDDAHDDQVDALINAYAAASKPIAKLVDSKYNNWMPKAR